MDLPDLFEHQKTTIAFLKKTPGAVIASDPGTGKTRCILEYFATLPGRKLVVCPKSIMEAAWGDDCTRWTPNQSYSVASATKRERAFTQSDSDIVIVNHDGVKKLKPEWLTQFTAICIDEVTAYKNPTAQRSRAIAKLMRHFERKVVMSGTLYTNSVTDVWHPVFLVDGGDRLDSKFHSFRFKMCEGTTHHGGPRTYTTWADRAGASEDTAALIQDITIRYKMHDCLDIPENHVTKVFVTLNAKTLDKYNEMLEENMMMSARGEIVTAVHAGVQAKKLLQICTGAVYDNEGVPISVHMDRYKLVLDLVEEREHCIVAFNWKHERDALAELAANRNLSFAFIDGKVTEKQRTQTVRSFQKGEIKVLFCHPAAAAHGLTLTQATTTIWCSPVYSSEQFQQFNRRIYRAGQTKHTETILIAARDTKEMDVYDVLDGKLERMSDLLTVFNNKQSLSKEVA